MVCSPMDSQTLGHLYREHLQLLQERVANILEKTKYDCLVIDSGAPKLLDPFDDAQAPFRSTAAFTHWCPITNPQTTLEFIPGKKPTLYIYPYADLWHGPPCPVDPLVADNFNIVMGVYDNPYGECLALTPRPTDWLAEVWDANPPEIVQSFNNIRRVKTAYELYCLRQANERALIGHNAVYSAFMSDIASRKQAKSELALHHTYLEAIGDCHTDSPYPNIVAQNHNAAILHHNRYNPHSPTGDATSLLIDAGAIYRGYCSDITRTYCKGTTKDSKLFTSLIKGMDDLQKALVQKITLGMPYEDLHNDSHYLIGDLLINAGIATGSVESLVENGITRAFFPHGLGHSLGLQVHDVGCKLVDPQHSNPYLRNTSTIEEGMVFTVEPGLYFIDGWLDDIRERGNTKYVNWQMVDTLLPFGGIRIEDDIAIEGGKTINLTRSAQNYRELDDFLP